MKNMNYNGSVQTIVYMRSCWQMILDAICCKYFCNHITMSKICFFWALIKLTNSWQSKQDQPDSQSPTLPHFLSFVHVFCILCQTYSVSLFRSVKSFMTVFQRTWLWYLIWGHTLTCSERKQKGVSYSCQAYPVKEVKKFASPRTLLLPTVTSVWHIVI